MKSTFLESTRQAVSILLGGLAMILVAILFAFVSLRIAIHGREVAVPNLSGLSDSDAAGAARELGLNVSVENRFYSPIIAPNHVLSQSPAAGSRVRRGWQIRVTESLGQQSVSVPDVTGQTERPASLILRRLLLEEGVIAHLPAPSPAGVILTQTPQPNSKGLNGPRVSLLVADDETAADVPAFVMPSIVGMTVGAASVRLANVGLHIGSSETPAQPQTAQASQLSATPAPAPVVSVPSGPATISSQSPLPGHRVTRADTIRVTLSN